MKRRIRRACIAFVFGLAACSDGPAGPDDNALTGQFGDADQPIELLATHAGVELRLGCGSYFVSDDPALVDEMGGFKLDGEFHQSGPPVAGDATIDATLRGSTPNGAEIDHLTVTLLINGGGPTVDPLVVTLHRDQNFEGVPLPCPA